MNVTRVVKCCLAALVLMTGLAVPAGVAPPTAVAEAEAVAGPSATPLQPVGLFETVPVGVMRHLRYDEYSSIRTDKNANPCYANGMGDQDNVEATYVDQPTWTARSLLKHTVDNAYAENGVQPTLTASQDHTVQYTYSGGVSITVKALELSFGFSYSTSSTVSKGTQPYYPAPGDGKKIRAHLGDDVTERTGIVWKAVQFVDLRDAYYFDCYYGRFLVNVETANAATNYAAWYDPIVPIGMGVLVPQAKLGADGTERSFGNAGSVYDRRPVGANPVRHEDLYGYPPLPGAVGSDVVRLKYDLLPNDKLSNGNRIAIYKRDQKPGQAAPVKAVAMRAEPTGAVEFPAEELPGGDYDAYVLYNGSNTVISGNVAKFTVRDAGRVTLGRSTYQVGDLVNITYTGNSPTTANKVGIYSTSGSPMGDRWSWAGRSTDTVSVSTAGLPRGAYQVRYLYGDGSTWLAAPAPLTVTAWSAWEDLGGALTSDPSTTSWGANRLDVFARGGGGQLVHKYWDGAAWSAWGDLGGAITGRPAAVSWGPNRIDVVALGSDGKSVMHKWWNGSTWSVWENLGHNAAHWNSHTGCATSELKHNSPVISSYAGSRLDIVYTDNRCGLSLKSWNGASWSAWATAQPPVSLTSVAAVSSALPDKPAGPEHRIDLFGTTTTSRLVHLQWGGTAWSAAKDLDAAPSKGLSASRMGAALDVWGTSATGTLMRKSGNGSTWSAWQQIAAALTGAPAAVSKGPGRIDVFGRRADNHLWHTWWQ